MEFNEIIRSIPQFVVAQFIAPGNHSNNEVMRNDDEIAIEANSWRIFFTEELAGCTNYREWSLTLWLDILHSFIKRTLRGRGWNGYTSGNKKNTKSRTDAATHSGQRAGTICEQGV
jgi:hypothetical protein